MCQAIDAAYKVDEVKDIRDKATEIRVRAERRVGTLLGEAVKNGQRDSGRGGNRRSPLPEAILPTLSDYGITKTQSSQWQQLSSIPDARDGSTTASRVTPENPIRHDTPRHNKFD
jgi:hypothetical protein